MSRMSFGKSMKRKGSAGLVFQVIVCALMSVLFLLCFYPFWYVLIYSLSDSNLAQQGVVLLPRGFTLSNYIKVLKLDGIASAFMISLLRTVAGTFLTVLCCSFLAYLVTKPIYGRKIIYRMLVITMYMNAGLIPIYLVYRTYHLTNIFWVYIIPSAVSAYNVILIKTFMESIPASLEESAKLDGAGYVTIFSRIMLPLSKPILATITVFASVGQWNSWFDNYIYVQSDKLKTLQLMLYEFLNKANQLAQASTTSLQRGLDANALSSQSVRMTITMVVTIPVLFVYPFMQKYFAKGIMLGAVKG